MDFSAVVAGACCMNHSDNEPKVKHDNDLNVYTAT